MADDRTQPVTATVGEGLTVLVNAGPWLDVPPPGYGGIENVVATLVPALRAQGVRVVLATVASSRLEADDRITTFATGRFADLARPYNEVAGLAHLHMQHVLTGIDRIGGIDLVHDHLEIVGPSLLAAAGTTVPPTLHTLHWDTDRHRQFYDQFDGRGRVLLNGVSASQLRGAGTNVRRQSVGHVYLAAPDVDDAPATERTEDLLVLGRICAKKGQDVAVRLARRLGAPLVLAGPVAGVADAAQLDAALADPDSPLHRNADVRYFCDEVEPFLDDRVRWVGSVGGAAKRELLRRSKALLMPIRWAEPGATVVVEALAAGTPVIGTRLGVMPELIDHGRTGLLVDEVDELADACAEITAIDPHRCLEEARRRFTAEGMAAGYIGLYRQVLAAAASPATGRSPAPSSPPSPSVAGPR